MAGDQGIQCREELFSRDYIYIADEVFFCGTAAEVTPISEVDYVAVGDGKPGPVTSALANLYFDAVHGRNEKYLSWLSFV
jgi:branched-chain amino acid aminotransferase